MNVEFIEAPNFTRQVEEFLSDEEYRKLQIVPLERPDSGNVIKGTGGIRKLRWFGSGRGKRGGLRVIYYWINHRNRIHLLLLYPKNVQDDLTPQQIQILKKIVEQLK